MWTGESIDFACLGHRVEGEKSMCVWLAHTYLTSNQDLMTKNARLSAVSNDISTPVTRNYVIWIQGHLLSNFFKQKNLQF